MTPSQRRKLAAEIASSLHSYPDGGERTELVLRTESGDWRTLDEDATAATILDNIEAFDRQMILNERRKLIKATSKKGPTHKTLSRTPHIRNPRTRREYFSRKTGGPAQ
jgi:hypothetical protein